MENNSKRKELTTRQEEILEYIKKYSKENRMPPTVREIGNHFDISSTNGVRSILAALIKKGYINRSPRLSRGLEIISNGNDSQEPAANNTIEIPIVGRVAAGQPILVGTIAVGSGRSVVGRGIAHLKHVVAGRQTGVSHAVLACRQGCPLLLESFHAIAVDALRLIAIMQG